LRDEPSWKAVVDTGNTGRLETTLSDTRHDAHTADARANINLRHFEAARDHNTVGALQTYLDAHPEGHYVDAAMARKTSLLADMQPYPLPVISFLNSWLRQGTGRSPAESAPSGENCCGH
jgi:hypothetical protein